MIIKPHRTTAQRAMIRPHLGERGTGLESSAVWYLSDRAPPHAQIFSAL
jgi:hypothetical protein